ncbi:MAG: amino acid racemase [Planctomycetes bacterium]|nr:amino acid racemase [Planctomycetota bacterium]
MLTIGILAHSSEGASLCFRTICHAGSELLGEHMHPPIVLSAIPMGLSMPGWRANDLAQVEPQLLEGAHRLARAGADFFVCPDNTAHLALERCIDRLPLPGLHIAEVIGSEIRRRGFSRVGLLGTRWTMAGEVYRRALAAAAVERLVPEPDEQEVLHGLIFAELCNGRFGPAVTAPFLRAIERLRARGAEAVILGCTEIPIIVDDANSALPTLDTTRLLARYAARLAVSGAELPANGWVGVDLPGSI